MAVYRKKYEKKVYRWGKLRSEGVSPKTAQEILGFSRATYYRMRKTLKELGKGIVPPSKKPKKVNKPRWSWAEVQLVLMIRRQNPTYGKEKIAIILKRDHMTVTKNGISFKHFQAWDRRSKFIDGQVYSNAKSSNAKRFLLDFVKKPLTQFFPSKSMEDLNLWLSSKMPAPGLESR